MCAHVAALRAKSSAAEAPLIELAVITGVAAGFPGIYSSTEHALPASGFYTYIHTHTHRQTCAYTFKCTQCDLAYLYKFICGTVVL